jgi:hypothetical protein
VSMNTPLSPDGKAVAQSLHGHDSCTHSVVQVSRNMGAVSLFPDSLFLETRLAAWQHLRERLLRFLDPHPTFLFHLCQHIFPRSVAAAIEKI